MTSALGRVGPRDRLRPTMDAKPIKVSEAIRKLQEILRTRGDLPMMMHSPTFDEGLQEWSSYYSPSAVDGIHFREAHSGWGDHVQITYAD